MISRAYYKLIIVMSFLMIIACSTKELDPAYRDARNYHQGYYVLPAAYQAGPYRSPAPGSPELFGLPETSEPGFYGSTRSNHYFSPNNACLPNHPDVEGVCANVPYLIINEKALKRKG